MFLQTNVLRCITCDYGIIVARESFSAEIFGRCVRAHCMTLSDKAVTHDIARYIAQILKLSKQVGLRWTTPLMISGISLSRQLLGKQIVQRRTTI
jgi:hypothetical protein